MTNTEALTAIRTYGTTCLVGADATRGRALEIRTEAKAQGVEISFKTDRRGSRPVIQLSLAR